MTPEERERLLLEWTRREEERLHRQMEEQRIRGYVTEMLEREREINRERDTSRERMLAEIRWLLWVVAVVSSGLLLHRVLVWTS